MDDHRPQTNAALIVAAGRGTRAGGEIPKQWQTLGGRRVIDWTLGVFRSHPDISQIVVVLHPDDMELLPDADLLRVEGGATRSASVRAGLEALVDHAPDTVLIHDAARATLPDHLITRILSMLSDVDAVAPGVPVSDALWSSTAEGAPEVDGTVDRTKLWRAQTPQSFKFTAILDAHRAHGEDAADDVEVARRAGIEVKICEGDPDNLKITTPNDFTRAERILKERQGGMDIRVGNGFDVHRFGPGDHVTLCGIQVPHNRALQGHSDADVGLHTITDAIYGALAEGDIGTHFPPSDPQWKGAASDTFLRHAVQLAGQRGFQISNVDLTFMCEMPKIGPVAEAMRARVGEIMGLDVDRISVKATTTERLGFTGRGEGIAATATVTLVST